MKILSTYQLNDLHKLNESMGANKSADILLKMGTIWIHDEIGKLHQVPTKSIIGVVNRALYKIQSEYTFFYRFISKINIIYLPEQNRYTKTMAVDDKGNMYICVSFVYNFCSMDVNKVFGILFHELMHILLDHCERDKHIPNINPREKKTHGLLNVAADYEVNCSMVADSIVRSDFWKNMNGYWDPKYTGIPYEKIFNDIKELDLAEKMGRDNDRNTDEIRQNIEDQLKKRREELLGELDNIDNQEPENSEENKSKKEQALDNLIKLKRGLIKISEKINSGKLSDAEIEKWSELVDKIKDKIKENIKILKY